ncbi:helix-turn-helix domain-containing protein [Halococcus sp. AFM35]|uniref:helix-turn-helix domain-containing protein n=1 Tax=Halococcus sp. AFM35 TaxID=3421653 RepID=UPI003EC0AE76
MSGDTPYDARDSTGRFAAKYDEQDILDAVRENEPAATSEVADSVGFARQNADYRLRRLENEGKVRSKKVGASLVWMLDEEMVA